MKPRISILDRAFAYKPSYATAIAENDLHLGSWMGDRQDEAFAEAGMQQVVSVSKWFRRAIPKERAIAT